MSELYLIVPIILILVVLVAALLDRWSVPVILISLGAGILFGSDVLNWYNFSDVVLTKQVANLALIFILFQGGFGTRKIDFQSVAMVAGGLATWGVALTSLATFVITWGVLGWPLETAALLAVIISSTDAAATFSILRRQSLNPRLASTVSIESAANDPMAILLTVGVMQALTVGGTQWYIVILSFLWKFVGGIAIGWLLAHASVWLFNGLRPQDRGHYYVLTLGVVLLIYSIAEVAQSSAMLAVFIAGYVLGNRPFVHKQGVGNFVSALATLADIGMFILMGLLVSPRQWSGLWREGILLFLVLTFISRPFAVWLSTLGMRLRPTHRIFISWAGLRGAVPIILATYPLAAGMPNGQEIFNLVFFTVILSITIQGSSLGVIANRLKLSTWSRPKPLYNLELVTMAASDMDLIVVDMPGSQGAPGPRIAELNLPEGSVISLITRGEEVVVPRGNTELKGWDQVTILGHVRDEARIRDALMHHAARREAEAAPTKEDPPSTPEPDPPSRQTNVESETPETTE